MARANPPPSRKMTPQHILVSMSLQVMREGEFLRLSFMVVKGQKSYVYRGWQVKTTETYVQDIVVFFNGVHI